MLNTKQARGLPDLADQTLPESPGNWLLEPVEMMEDIAGKLGPLTKQLVDMLHADNEEAFDLVESSSHLYQEAEELIRIARDSNVGLELPSVRQLASRFEQALSRLNCITVGLKSNPRASYLDVVHLKRELQLVWNVLRDVDRKSVEGDSGVVAKNNGAE